VVVACHIFSVPGTVALGSKPLGTDLRGGLSGNSLLKSPGTGHVIFTANAARRPPYPHAERPSTALPLPESARLVRPGRLGADHSPQAVNAECDVRVELGGIDFVGTDHVFRFARQRVEVFSAMPKELHEILKTGDGARAYAEKMPEVVAACRRRWAAVQRDWTGIITMDGDGAVMALRVLKSEGRPLEAIPEPQEGPA
jgi:hypothetical protein